MLVVFDPAARSLRVRLPVKSGCDSLLLISAGIGMAAEVLFPVVLPTASGPAATPLE